MAVKKRKRKGLPAFAEEFAIALLYEASGGTIGRVRKETSTEEKSALSMSFHDRRALLDSMTKLIAMKHKIDPEEEEEDGIEAYREQLNDGNSSANSDGRDSVEAEDSDSLV